MKKFLIQAFEQEVVFPLAKGQARLSLAHDDSNALLTISLVYHGAFGMGEKFNSINQKGNIVVNQVEEKFCFQGEKTYCPMPFFFTDSGFGLFVDTDEVTTFDFADNILVHCPKNAQIILFDGSPESIIAEYISLHGAAVLPPKWAFGPWISANRWNTQSDVEQQLMQLKKHRFPATVLVVEAWSDEATFYIFNGAKYTPASNGDAFRNADFNFDDSVWPNPAKMIEMLHRAGVHLVLWQIPVYKKQSADEVPNRQNELDREDAVARHLCVMTKAGIPYTIPDGHWFAGSMIPDFTNETTRKTWFAKRQYLLDIGVDGFKTDGGEFIYTSDACFADGTTGKDGINRYAESYTESYTQFLGNTHVLFSRAGYSGAHTTPMHWGGDQQSQNSELYSVLTAGLSAALSGILFWGFDIAGFAGPLPSLDLYRRATQLAVFCPVMQWHSEPDGGQFRELMAGGEGNNERSPWNMASRYQSPHFIGEMRYWHHLRMNLLPYLYCTALTCVAESKPMMRPMAYLYPEDERLLCANSQFMLGDSLLIAPLLAENETTTTVALPNGTWFSLFSGKKQNGGCNIISDDIFPVYLKAGSALPLNVTAEKKLGTDVGNRVDKYDTLHFILAGSAGNSRFRDDMGNDFRVDWHCEQWTVTGTVHIPITAQIWS
ncbi:MAG: glycoside hydrolase family 31 protein [Ruthenibacterium sp.]